MDYQQFLETKLRPVIATGKPCGAIHPVLFDFQMDIVRWAVERGKAAIFADIGLGKTVMQCEIARQMDEPTLIIAPLAVAKQTVRMAKQHLDMDWQYIRNDDSLDFDNGLFYITNYEMVVNGHVDPQRFRCVILDESSILKSFSGATRRQLQKGCSGICYKFAFTATPAPNDLLEITNHSDWLELQDHSGNALNGRRIIAKFFITDDEDRKAGSYRLKKQAVGDFYRWMASWSIALTKPSDIGPYADTGYILPELIETVHKIDTEFKPVTKLKGADGQTYEISQMFPVAESPSAIHAKKLRNNTVSDRVAIAANLINASDEQWLVFCGLNVEAEQLNQAVNGSFDLHGSLKPDEKESAILRFQSGELRVLITKSSIAGMGINLQQCHNMIFLGIDYSWEQYYQSLGRIRRFGQESDFVQVHIIISNQDDGILKTIQKKGKQAEAMKRQLIDASSLYMKEALGHAKPEIGVAYQQDSKVTDEYRFDLGDSCERMAEIPSDSMGAILYSPPFGHTLYIYSNTPRDLGNNDSLNDFMAHYRFIIDETYRVLMPGRLVGVHIQDTKIYANNSEIGERGIYPLSDDIVTAHLQAGFVYRGRVAIDKNPQLVATRNHDTDLLFVTGKRDSTDLAPMNTDYILLFKKPGINPVPVLPYENGLTEEDWIRLAHAVWYDIDENDTLNIRVARSANDERHICPLQLGVVDNFVRLYTNPGETLFSPFGGIGSEGYQSILRGRRFWGIELKPEYWKVGIRNLEEAVRKASQGKLI